MLGGFPVCVKIDKEGPGSLFQGNIFAAKSQETLKENKIRAVVSVIPKELWESSKSSIPLDLISAHCLLPSYDDSSFKISQHFDDAYAFISKEISMGRNVLVHCEAGVSRSSAITIAFFMKKYKLSFAKAEKRLEQVYPRKRLNAGFRKQLIDYQDQLFPRMYSV